MIGHFKTRRELTEAGWDEFVRAEYRRDMYWCPHHEKRKRYSNTRFDIAATYVPVDLAGANLGALVRPP